ncbi:quinone oxidoreductase family protein [Croceicoccus ponticola]|nr:zinc-binding dehydrogenase [Croceicoccus ponticola]
MRAAVLHKAGGPDVFRIEDVPVPVAGRDDVLLKVEACGVSYRDVVERNGTYRRDVSFPCIIGLEIAGTVVETGADVEGLAVGDRVCTKAFSSCGRCRLCRNGRETTCARRKPISGGYAEYVAVPQDSVVRIPQELGADIACSLGPAAGVALNAVRDVAKVRIGETVLITGATGGVGVPSMQIAKASGARVIAITRSLQKAKTLRDLGASDVVIAETGENFAPRVRELTKGQGVDVVIDNVGSAVFDASYDSLAVHGRYAMVGQLFGEEVSINPARIFFKRAKILGVGSVSRTQLEDTIVLAEWGIVKPNIASRLPLEDVATAHELVEGGAVNGRVVLIP